MCAASEVQELTLIQTFHYPLASMQRQNDNEQMVRLNYMASRLCAALTQWATASDKGTADLWWRTGVQKELVT